MEENKELETTTEEQASVTPAANDGREKRLISQWPYRWLCGHVADRGAVSLSLFRSTTS